MSGYESRLVPHHDLGDLGCPRSLSYRLTHGPSAGTADAIFKIVRNPPNPASKYRATRPYGKLCTIQCDQSFFHGYVVGVEETADDSSGEELLKVSMVDWRDRLHDNLFFAAFNMLDEDGYSWHMLPDDWVSQRMTVITKEIEVQDFDVIQDEKPVKLDEVAKKTLVTSATILHKIAELGVFKWTALNGSILELLTKTRPMNLDWRDGTTFAEAIEDILSKSNLQWTVLGPDTILITQIGCDCSPSVAQFLAFKETMCESLDGRSSSRGEQLNEDSLAIRIVGGRNKKQFTFPCRQDWNIMFDFRLCFDTYTMQLLLKKHGLTMMSKLGELPSDYHDDTPIESPDELGADPGRKTRNDLTVEEYLSDVCFKTYLVDFNNASRTFLINMPKFHGSGTYEPLWLDVLEFKEPEPEDPPPDPPDPPPDPDDPPPRDEEPLSDYDWDGEIEAWDAASWWPISSNLVTETAHRMIVHRTAYILSKDETSPFETQHFLSPGNQGVSLEVDEVPSSATAHMLYVARLKFTDPTFYIEDIEDFESHDKVKPDRILVTLSLDWTIYENSYGLASPPGGITRSREKKHSISGLHKAYVDDEEVFVMAQSVRRRLNDGIVQPALKPISADDVAEHVANRLKNIDATVRSGNMLRKHHARFNVDGVITSINVSFDATGGGLTESLSFGGTQNFITENYVPPSIYRVSRLVPTTAKVSRERIEKQASHVISEAMRLPQSVSDRRSLPGSLKAATNIRFFSEFWRGINSNSSDASVEFQIIPDDPYFKGSMKGGVIIVEEGPEKHLGDDGGT